MTITAISTTLPTPPTTQSLFHGDASSTAVTAEGSNNLESARITLAILKHLDEDLPKSREQKQLIMQAKLYGGKGGWFYGETLNGLPHGKGVLKFFGKDGKLEVEYKGHFKDGQEHDLCGELYWYYGPKVVKFTGKFYNGVAYGHGHDEFGNECKLVGSKIVYDF